MKSLSYSDSTPNRKLFPEQLAYIVYTSGSTGNPKGVACTHKGVLNLLSDTIIRNPNLIGAKCSLWTSLNFDPSIYEMFIPICFGGELNIIPEEIRPVPNEVFSWISKNKIASAYLPPFFLKDFGEWLQNNYNSCKLVNLLVGVEPITFNTLSNIKKSIPDISIINGYGPSETTVYSTCYNFDKIVESDHITPIGKPIMNTKIYLLDEDLHPVPIGVKGEIFISSAGIARGYINNSRETAERFIPDFFSKIGGDRLYKTGDLAKYSFDGNITFLGRADHQIKIRGFRVELGEIGSIIKKHDKIKDAVVIADQNKVGAKILIGYYTTFDSNPISSNHIITFLNESLPNYMIPSQVIHIDSIPLLPNGKINRKALPKPIVLDSKERIDFVKPNTEKEKIIANAIQQVLKINNISADDNFFELGGDSIIAIQVIAKLKQSGLSIKPVQLFQYQTISKLADVAEDATFVEADQGILEGYLKFNAIQKYFIEKEFINRNHWNQSLLFKVNKKLNEKFLDKTCRSIAMHHDALRIRINENNDNDLIINTEYDTRSLEIIDLTEAEFDKTQKIEVECKKAQSSLSLIDGPIFKVVYFLINENDGRLLFVFHHLIIDGISWRILLEDFQLIYNAFENDKKYTLPLKTTSIKKWSESIYRYLNSNEIKNQEEHWIKVADSYDDINIFEFNKGANLEKTVESISFSLNEQETKNLTIEVNKKYNTKIDDILLIALILSYSKWSGKRSMHLFMEGHGRSQISEEVDLSRTVGWFTSLYPIYLDLKKSVTIEEIIKTIKEENRTIPNEGFGYSILRYLSGDLNLRNKLKVLDSIPITFNYLGQLDKVLSNDSIFQIAKENKGLERDEENERTSIIDINGSISLNKLSINFSYSKNYFSKENITNWMNNYRKALQEIITHCLNQDEKTFTSSDFNLANLNNQKLDKVLSKLKKNK